MSLKIYYSKEITTNRSLQKERFITFGEHIQALKDQKETLRSSDEVERWKLKAHDDFVKDINALAYLYNELLYSTNLLQDIRERIRGDWFSLKIKERVRQNNFALHKSLEAGNDA